MLHFSVDMDSSFSNAELAQILDRPSRFIIDWSERGLIEADITPATGPGSRRRYSYQAVLRAALGIHLKDRYGMSRHIIKNILDQLSGFDFFADWSGDFVKSQKAYYENIVEWINKEPDNPVFQEMLAEYQQKVSNPPSLINSGCLSILFREDGGYSWFADKETLKEIASRLDYRMGEEKKKGNIITDIVILDLGAIKNSIDQRIKALP